MKNTLHEAWARDQIARRGIIAWSDPAVKNVFNSWLITNEPNEGWDSYEEAKSYFERA